MSDYGVSVDATCCVEGDKKVEGEALKKRREERAMQPEVPKHPCMSEIDA